MVHPNFVIFYRSFIFAYTENFVCLTQAIEKFEFWHPRLGEIPIAVHPNFVIFYLSRNMITSFKYFMCLA